MSKNMTCLGGKKLFPKILLLVFVLALFMSYVRFVLNKTDSQMRDELLTQAKILANSINVGRVLNLTATEDDLNNRDFIRLKEQFENVLSVNPKYIYIYLMGRNENKEIYYYCEVQSYYDQDSPPEIPGTIYEYATQELISVFDNGIPFVEGPVEDEWGVWVSAITPVLNPKTNEIIAILGIDIEAGLWKWTVIYKSAYPIIIMIFLMILGYFSIIILQSRNLIYKREKRVSLQRSAITSYLLDKNHTNNTDSSPFNYLTKLVAETLDVNIVSIWIFSENGEKLQSVSLYSKESNSYSETKEVNSADIANFIEIVKQKDILTVSNTLTDSSLKEFLDIHIKKMGISSLMDAAIVLDSKLLGFLCIEVKGINRVWNPDEETFASTIATLISQIIAQERQKEAESKLLETHHILITTLESMTDGFISFDADFSSIFHNSHALKLLTGVTEPESKDVWNIFPVNLKENLKNNLINSQNNNSPELFNLYNEDNKKWLEFRTYPSSKGLSVFFQDITEKKQAEKAVIESQRLSAIGEMSNSISHDFNNYLQIILGSIEVVGKKFVFTEEMRKYIEIIKNATIDASTRVKLLQRFTGTSNITTEYSAVNINHIIEEAILQTQPLWKNDAESKGLAYKITNNFSDVKMIKGNVSELRTVIFNLIKNSLEAMPNGGEIRFKTGMIDNFVYAHISDTGIGMDDETQERVFQPLFTTKGFELGKGFGLSSSFTIVKEHKGSLKILESGVNQGTVFEILLPATDEKAYEENESTTVQDKLKILWVDDDAMIRNIAGDMLDILGYKADFAESGEEALNLINKNQYNLVITDIGMPGMSGWQLLDEINKLKNNYLIKTAIVSGWGDQISDKQRLEHQFDFILSKPVKLNELNKLFKDFSEDRTPI